MIEYLGRNASDEEYPLLRQQEEMQRLVKAAERNGEGSVGIIGKNGIRLLDPDVLRVKKSRERILSVG